MKRGVLAALAAVALLVAGVGGAAVVMGSGADGLDVHAVTAATPPPRDADLATASWPAAAAWIAREADAGRPTVVNLFASWCVPCRQEAPLLAAAAASHPEVAFLGIDHMDLRAAGEQFVAEYDLPFATLYDPAGEVAAAIAARGMPTTAFFDSSGRLVDLHTGELTEQLLAERVAAVVPEG